MSTTPFSSMSSGLIWMNSALLDRITPFLRAVTVKLFFEDKVYQCYFFYDGPIDDELFDLASCAAAEASDSWFCDDHILQVNFPSQIPLNGFLAYLRKEPDLNPPKIELLPRSINALDEAYLSYTLQQGLLGRVIPSLRCVLIDIQKEFKSMWFYFFYDEKITEELKVLVQEAVGIAAAGFPSDYKSLITIEFVPYPQPIPNVGIRYVYKRKE